ncbi:MAG TPA: MipA/OmpV family protein [Cellvibrionaceae bacterium]
MSNLVVRFLIIGCFLLQAALVDAAGPTSKLCQAPCSSNGNWELSVGLGLGLSTNPLKGGSDIPLLVRPKLSYYGERFFLDNLEAGFTLWENPSQQINLLVLPSLEQLYFRRWQYAASRLPLHPDFSGGDGPTTAEPQPATPKLHYRHTSALSGFEYTFSQQGFEFNFQLLDEISGYHSGREMRLAVSRDFLDHWRISFGANFQSRDYINYYYGVYSQEATQTLPVYLADRGGWSKLVRVEYLKPINQHFALKASSAIKVFSSEIAASPLMEESRVYSIFLGGVYYF